MKAYFSNRIYKNELEDSVLNIIEKLKMDYSYIRNYAFQLIRYEQMGRITFLNTTEEPFNSLYFRVDNRFPDVPIYLRNTAIQDAKAVYKSQQELVKLQIDNLEEKINKVDNKILKTKQQKDKLQEMKDQLKLGYIPIGNKGRKYKLLENGSVVVTYGKGKKKRSKNNQDIHNNTKTNTNLNQVVYDNIYVFETQYISSKIKLLRQRIGVLTFKKNKLQDKLNKISRSTYVPNVIFGSKKLQKQSVLSKSKRKEWLSKRYNRLEISGRCDSIVGNFIFEYQPELEKLIITVDKVKYDIPNVKFPYGQDKIVEYYNLKKADRLVKSNKDKQCNKPITYSIEDKGKYYIIKCHLEELQNNITNYSLADGVIGVDTNLGFFSISNVDANGNLLNTTNITYGWKGKTSNQVSNNIENAVKELVDIALREKKPICIEKLKIKGSKKIKDYNSNKSKNFGGNMFAYDKMTSALKSRAKKCGVEVYEVEPQYTSLIGYIKYMPYYKLSVHNMASYVIGRRCLGYEETIPNKYENTNTDWKQIYKTVNKKKVS